MVTTIFRSAGVCKLPSTQTRHKNRQNSLYDLYERTKARFEEAQDLVWTLSKRLYDKALEKGIAKECARMLLPLNTKTKMYMTNNLRNWMHYVDVRTEPSTQLEQLPVISKAMGGGVSMSKEFISGYLVGLVAAVLIMAIMRADIKKNRGSKNE